MALSFSPEKVKNFLSTALDLDFSTEVTIDNNSIKELRNSLILLAVVIGAIVLLVKQAGKKK